MRILQAFEFLSLPHGGGTVEVISKLSQALVNRGHIVTICASDYEIDWDYIDSLKGVNVRVFHNWFRLFGTCMPLNMMGIDVRDYDVIHLHCYRSFQNVVLSRKALKYHVPYVIDAHGSNKKIRKGILKSCYDRCFGNLLSGASKIIAETENDIPIYKSLGVEDGKIEVIRSFIGIDDYASSKKGLFRIKYNINTPIILFVGRINYIKGLDYLVDSFNHLLNKYDATLVIVGQDDGYKSELKQRIYHLGIVDKVIFTGYLDGENKISALTDADILIQPSMYEAGARPSIEAILCDTPAIVTAGTGAGNEIQKMQAGYLVEYGNVKELSNTMRYILEHKKEAKDKTLQTKQYIKDNLSIGKQVEKYENIYKKVFTSD